jgi:hypothetical protein
MTIQYGVALRNNLCAQFEATLGTGPSLCFYTGIQPVDCAASASGVLLGTITLPSDWLTSASNGVVSMNGVWSTSMSAAGSIGHYRFYDSTGTTCSEQGSVTATGGGGDMTVDSISVVIGQTVTATTFSKTAPGA